MILVVGAGLSGATVARVLAEAGKDVAVVDRRSHLAGNCFDYVNEFMGARWTRVHKYGPHIFHTKNETVWNFLSRFTEWVPYEHRVRAILDGGQSVPFPPNAETLAHVEKKRLLETFYTPYTLKMWDKSLSEVNPKILERVPMRDDLEDRYFPNDPWQAMPKYGYTGLVSSMLDHENITVRTRVHEYRDWFYDEHTPTHTFTSEAIDEYFDYQLGDLPYRSIKFDTVCLPLPPGASKLLPATTCNFTSPTDPHTRVTEWAQFPNSGPRITSRASILTFETPYSPQRGEEKYYPVVDKDSRSLYKAYSGMVPDDVTFIGRLGLFAYLDMDQAVNSALAAARKYLSSCDTQTSSPSSEA
jgi:UDP-galactopyranose mutase